MSKQIVASQWVSVLLLVATLAGIVGCAASQPAADTNAAQDDTTVQADTTVQQAADEDEVNIGYGTVKRSQATGAISTVDVETVRRERNPTILADLIRGNVAGVDVSAVGGRLRVQIRGVNSIHGSTTPLYVVDGLPVRLGPRGVLNVVNPNDVASITVLKGPEAAIYGSRGANGVIIVETK